MPTNNGKVPFNQIRSMVVSDNSHGLMPSAFANAASIVAGKDFGELEDAIRSYAVGQSEPRALAIADALQILPESNFQGLATVVDNAATRGIRRNDGLNLMPFDMALFEHLQKYISKQTEKPIDKVKLSDVVRYALVIATVVCMEADES